MTTDVHTIIVTDANVLINLMYVTRLDMCARLPGYEFVIPDHVREEITEPSQRSALDEAIGRGAYRVEAITTVTTVELFGELIGFLGRGEAACLALAVERGWSIASDEKGRFPREAERRIGSDRIMGAKDLYVLAIRAGLLTIERADDDKAVFLADMDMSEPGLDRVIHAGYALLGLQTFFSTGPKEVRAWTIHKGDTALQAAGAIHTDFERGFIRAEIITCDDYIAFKGEHGAKEAGKMRLEGKDYVVREGDVIYFRFNV